MQLGKLTRVSARSQTCIDRAAGPETRRKAAGDNGKPDGKTTVIRIPGDRKMIIAPHGGDAWEPAKPRPDETLIRALARAHRWKRMLEDGTIDRRRRSQKRRA